MFEFKVLAVCPETSARAELTAADPDAGLHAGGHSEGYSEGHGALGAGGDRRADRHRTPTIYRPGAELVAEAGPCIAS